MYHPLHIDVREKKILVIGVGKVGRRRIEKLLKSGATITAIDRKRLRIYGVKIIRKDLTPNDLPSLRPYFLVVAATNNKKLNSAIAEKAKREGCLVNRVDLSGGGDVIFPAIVETSSGTLSFSTLGKNPALSKRIKEALGRELPLYKAE